MSTNGVHDGTAPQRACPHFLWERAAQAQAAASEAITHCAALQAESHRQLDAASRVLVLIDATREMLRQSVQRCALLMKALDVPPVGALRLVQDTVAKEVLPSVEAAAARRLVDDVTAWWLEAYYDISPAA